MLLWAKIWITVLVAGMGGFGYWNYQLYSANLIQAEAISELRIQARSVENIRADVVRQIEEALQGSSSRLLAAADAIEGRIRSLERDADKLKGFGWTSTTLGVADLELGIGAVEKTTQQQFNQVLTRLQALELCVQSLSQDLNRDFGTSSSHIWCR
jgi:hypothetical protein